MLYTKNSIMQTKIFYYTLALMLFVLIDASILFPTPRNFVFAFLLVPILIFFLITKRDATPNNDPATRAPVLHPLRSSLALLLVGLLVAAFTYSLKQPSITKVLEAQTESTNELKLLNEALLVKDSKNGTLEIAKEVQNLKREITMLRNALEVKDKILGLQNVNEAQIMAALSPSPTPTPRYVTIKSNQFSTVNVYQEKTAASNLVGKAQFGKTYEFTKKEDEYYFITLSATAKGWVQASVMKETTP
jgi:hypothetical protein